MVVAVQVHEPARRAGRNRCRIPPYKREAGGSNPPALARSEKFFSVTSFYTNPFDASYGASKAAAWSLTNGVRLELHHQGTLVVAVHAASSTPTWPR
jgi:NAD(P)-dependent dehydrogenase (short-subunit alcohol dehydrogenase family)